MDATTQSSTLPVPVDSDRDGLTPKLSTSTVLQSHDLDAIARLIRQDRESLLAQWRQQVRKLPSAHHLDVPTLNDHVPALLEELAEALGAKSDATIAESLVAGSPAAHGLQRVHDGFNIVEVVAEYNILRGCIHDLVEARGLRLQGKAFHILNLVLDGAIGLAVDTYATQGAAEIQQRREEYLGFVTHDLRTPLNAIALSAKLLEATPVDNPRTTQIIGTLHRNVRYLEALVGKVLDENNNLQADASVKVVRRSCDLWPLVESLIQDLRLVAEKGNTVLVNVVPDELVIFADADLLRRIFQNLISNAMVYTPRGEIRIGAQDRGADGIECWVSDNGAGIPAELLTKVFEKGEGDPGQEGSKGLGLAIVKSFVQVHDGMVRAESEAGAGTTIRFTLPPRPQVTH